MPVTIRIKKGIPYQIVGVHGYGSLPAPLDVEIPDEYAEMDRIIGNLIN